MRVLVTGGAGFIGSITTRALVDAGHECVVLDSLERGFADAVDPRAEFFEGNVGDEVALGETLPGCDAVMHLAGYIEVAESQADPGRYFRNNAAAPLALLDAMVRHAVTGICYSSTAAVYGQPRETPITEDAPAQPINAYGASKLAFEHELDWFGVAHGIRSVRFRYFNVAGAWPDGSLGEAHVPETHLIPRVLAAMREGHERFELYGGDYPTADGTCVRDYIHVVDLARAHLLGLQGLQRGAVGGVYNLGNQRGFSNREVVETCGQVTGHSVEIDIGPRRPGDPAVLVASSEKAQRELGWAPDHMDLQTIVADAWRWHVAHPDGYR